MLTARGWFLALPFLDFHQNWVGFGCTLANDSLVLIEITDQFDILHDFDVPIGNHVRTYTTVLALRNLLADWLDILIVKFIADIFIVAPIGFQLTLPGLRPLRDRAVISQKFVLTPKAFHVVLHEFC